MSAEYSVEEVRARFEAWAAPTYGIARHLDLPDQYAATGVQCAWAAWQAAYAERIKADDGAVAVATSCADHTKGETGYCTFHARVPWGTKLYARPPAQAASTTSLGESA